MALTVPEWLLCRECNKSRKHVSLFNHEETMYAGPDPQGLTIYSVVQCKGCETIGFAVTDYEEGRFYNIEGGGVELLPHVELYPKAIAGRPQLNDLIFLPATIRHIYDETHTALCNGSTILSAIGIRAIIEAVCKEALEFNGNLEQRVDALQREGMLSKAGAKILHVIRDIGNGAAHEGKPHTMKELGTVFEVIDHLLVDLYILPGKAKHLPVRPPKEMKKKNAGSGLPSTP